MARGRKTKLDADMIERICELIRLQMSWGQIGNIVGVDPKTLRNWRERGSQEKPKRGDKIYREFVEEINRADAEMYEEAVSVFRNAIRGGEKILHKEVLLENGIPVRTKITEKELAPNWKAALEWLSRRHPETWGRYETLRLETDLRSEAESMGLDVEQIIAMLAQTIEMLMAGEDIDVSQIVALVEPQSSDDQETQ